MPLQRVDSLPGEFAQAKVCRVPIAPLDDRPAGSLPGWDRLRPAEQAEARAASPRRVREYVAGRCALRGALKAAGAPESALRTALLRGEQGRPEVPDGWTGSITHKAGWVFAVAAARPRPSAPTFGIDSEVLGVRDRRAIARHVLRPDGPDGPGELSRWQADGSWRSLLQAFSTKEAIYKALHPRVPRYIGFHEAEIDPLGEIRMSLTKGEGPFRVIAHPTWEGDRILVVVAAAPA